MAETGRDGLRGRWLARAWEWEQGWCPNEYCRYYAQLQDYVWFAPGAAFELTSDPAVIMPNPGSCSNCATKLTPVGEEMVRRDPGGG